MHWKEKYPRNTQPAYSDLLGYFPEDTRRLFLLFNQEMNDRYGVYNKWHRYEKASGWVYGFCRNYRCELLSVTVHSDCFRVLGVSVKDEDSLQNALEEAQKAYDDGYEERYADICAKRRANQMERTKIRVAHEQIQMEKMTLSTDRDKFNQFKWCKKVSRSDLLRLYQSEAKGRMDEELLDEIGYLFYTRCTQAKEARKLMDKGRILCLHCGTALPKEDPSAVVACGCGYGYTYREYRRSCNAANMPGGRATPIFEHFAQKWPGCRDATQKMMLIDWLIHECHVTLMSGLKGRSVGVNLIEGTKKQVTEFILKLAYDTPEGVNLASLFI